MKNNSKRICALLLAIVMCIGCVVPVFAETTDVHNHAETDVCPGADVEHTMTNCTNKFVKTVPAQCGKFGYDLYECTTCETPIATNWTNIDNEGHKMPDEWTVVKAPTCDEYGVNMRVCTECGYEEYDKQVAKRQHDMTNDLTNEYLCKDGVPAWKEWCKYDDCDYEIKHAAEAGHDCVREIVEILVPPTCYSTGLAKVACTHEHCPYVEDEVVVLTTAAGNAVGPHSWVFDSITTAATCGTAASGKVKCSVCGTVADALPGAGADAGKAFVTVTYMAVDKEGNPVETTEAIDVTALGFAATGVHDFSVDVPAEAPDCDDDGVIAHSKCSMCDAITLDKTANPIVIVDATAIVDPATGHDWEDFAEVPSSCTKTGTKAHSKCKTCGVITLDKNAAELELVEEADLVIAPAHSYDLAGAPVAEAQPTCTSFGFKFYGCTICGMPSTASGNENIDLPADEEGWVSAGVYRIPMLPHQCTETVTPGDCTTATVTVRDCDNCDFTETITGEIPGHTWKDVKYEATCQHDGYTFDYCTVCGLVAGADESDGIQIEECVTVRVGTATEEDATKENPATNGKYAVVPKAPDNHEWDLEKRVISTSPTCTAPGESLDYCPYCSVYEHNPVPANGHDQYNYVKTVAPTCTTAGWLVYNCSVCGLNEGKLTPDQLTENHEDYDANSKLDLKALGHSIEGVTPIHTKATCTKNGSDKYKCVRYGQTGCGNYSETKTLDETTGQPLYPALNHTWLHNGESSISTEKTLPKCVVSDTELKGVNGKIVEYCEQCSYSKKLSDIIFDWNNPEHHPGSAVNKDTLYHNGVKYDTPELADDAAKAAGATEADGLYRKGDCDKSQLTDYYCDNCKKTFFAEDDSMVGTHVGTPSGYVAPDCTNTGIYAHYECAVCKDDNGNPNKILVNAEGQHVIYKDDSALVIPATGHTWTAQSGTPATCLADGVKPHYTCSCGVITLDKDADPVVLVGAADLVAPALDHDWGEIGGKVAPSCGVDGVLAHYECQREGCDAVSLDGKVAVDASKIVDPALTHNYIHSTLVKAECVTAGYQYHYCNICGDEYVDNYVYPLGHTLKNVDKKSETCALDGVAAHVECEKCGNLFAEGTTDVLSETYVTADSLVISATGIHLYDAKDPTSVIKDTCAPGVDFSDKATCDVCKNLIAIEHTALESNDVDASCTEYGYTVEYCADCGYEKVTKKAEFAPTGHNYQWVVTTPAEMYKGGVESYMCVAGNGSKGCGHVQDTRDTEALGGIEFSYELDNAIYSGAEYVNGGKIKLTIKYKAANVDLASVALRLNYDADVLTYVSGDFKCEAVDADGNKIFDINNAAIGGKTAGYIVVTAKTFGFGEEPVDKKLNGEGIFAEVYFNINKNVDDGADIYFAVAKTGLSASQVLKSDSSTVYANFGAEDVNGYVVAEETVSLGDIDIDDNYTSADEIEFLDIAFSKNYVAAADINQDGMIGSDDYMLLQDLLLGNITYEEMCEAAQAVEPVA